MPIIEIEGTTFTPEEARDAIAIRDWLAKVNGEGS